MAKKEIEYVGPHQEKGIYEVEENEIDNLLNSPHSYTPLIELSAPKKSDPQLSGLSWTEKNKKTEK